MKKQTWKSIFLSLIAIFTLFLLGACGQQSVQKSYLQGISQEKKTDVRITIEHKGDKAVSYTHLFFSCVSCTTSEKMTEESANTYPLSAILNTAFLSSFTKSCSIVNGVLGRISPFAFFN